jgi:hypothetical protein
MCPWKLEEGTVLERGFVSLRFTASVRETCTAMSVLSADLVNLLVLCITDSTALRAL